MSSGKLVQIGIIGRLDEIREEVQRPLSKTEEASSRAHDPKVVGATLDVAEQASFCEEEILAAVFGAAEEARALRTELEVFLLLIEKLLFQRFVLTT